jgi:hypothetical protein
MKTHVIPDNFPILFYTIHPFLQIWLTLADILVQQYPGGGGYFVDTILGSVGLGLFHLTFRLGPRQKELYNIQ